MWLVPALRFPEFTDEWKEVLFASNLERLENGANYNTNDKDGVPMSRIETISTGRIDYTKVGHCSTPQKIEHYIMRYGDILFSHINSLKHIGKTAYYSAEEPLYHGMNLLLFRCKNNVDSKFFFFLINNTHFIRKCQILAKQAVNQASISTSDLKKIKVYIPDINEQSKIQKFLSLIEKRIELQNKIIEDLKKLKSAISQIIFSNATLVKIQNLCEVIMGQSPSSSSYNSNNDGLPLIQGNLDILGGVTISRIYTNEPTKISFQNDLILTVRAPVGIVAENKMKVCIGRGVCALRNKSAIPTMYIYYALDYFSYKWKQIEQGSTFTSINGDDIKNFTIPLVDAAEYSCAFLSKVDALIKCSIDLHSNYIKQKQYLLLQLFI